MEPHPEHDEQPEPRTASRGAIIAAVVIAGLVLVVIVLHLTGTMSVHGR